MPEAIEDDVRQMLNQVDLTSVRCYEISAKALDGFPPSGGGVNGQDDDSPAEMTVQVRRADRTWALGDCGDVES